MEDIKNREKIISSLIIAEVITVLNIKLKVNKELIQKVYNALDEDFTVLEDVYLFDKKD